MKIVNIVLIQKVAATLIRVTMNLAYQHKPTIFLAVFVIRSAVLYFPGIDSFRTFTSTIGSIPSVSLGFGKIELLPHPVIHRKTHKRNQSGNRHKDFVLPIYIRRKCGRQKDIGKTILQYYYRISRRTTSSTCDGHRIGSGIENIK